MLPHVIKKKLVMLRWTKVTTKTQYVVVLYTSYILNFPPFSTEENNFNFKTFHSFEVLKCIVKSRSPLSFPYIPQSLTILMELKASMRNLNLHLFIPRRNSIYVPSWQRNVGMWFCHRGTKSEILWGMKGDKTILHIEAFSVLSKHTHLVENNGG